MSRSIKNEELYVQKRKTEKAKLKKIYLKFRDSQNHENPRLHLCPECGLTTCGTFELPHCNYCEWDKIKELEVA